MKPLRFLLVILIVLLTVPLIASAGDFDWMKDFDIRAEADTSGLRARLESRFQVGYVKIKTVLSNVERPADAYMLLRLGEMSNQPIDRVIKKYKDKKIKGWGVLANSLGIKPGSKDFHALKRGQDLYDNENKGKNKSKNKDKGKEKIKGKNKGGE